MAFLEDGAMAHGEQLAAGAARLETVSDNAFGVFLARLRADTLEDADGLALAIVAAVGQIGPFGHSIATTRSKPAVS